MRKGAQMIQKKNLEILAKYCELLYARSNQGEESITGILDKVSSPPFTAARVHMLVAPISLEEIQ